MTTTRRLRELLQREAPLLAPGAYDGITARLVAQAGFDAAYMTGAGTAATLGYPDFGLLTLSEMMENAGRVALAAGIPVIADADTGYGNALNVTRTVREYEKRGIAGLHLEDQVSPKRCGHLDGKEIVPREAWLANIRAAVAARRDPDFLLIARTDARAVAGFDEAIARANAALDAGADMAFVEAVTSLEELALVPKRVRGPCLLNIVPGGKSPIPSAAEAASMGYRLIIYPSLLIESGIRAGDAALAALHASGRPAANAGQINIVELFNRLGAQEWNALQERLATQTPESIQQGIEP